MYLSLYTPKFNTQHLINFTIKWYYLFLFAPMLQETATKLALTQTELLIFISLYIVIYMYIKAIVTSDINKKGQGESTPLPLSE